MDLALHTTARSILWPQLVYGPYMLRKPSPHTFPATEKFVSSETRNKIFESGKPEDNKATYQWGARVCRCNHFTVVGSAMVVLVNRELRMSCQPSDSLHAQMSAPFKGIFSTKWALFHKCSMDSWVISPLITMGSAQVHSFFNRRCISLLDSTRPVALHVLVLSPLAESFHWLQSWDPPFEVA